MARDFPRCRIVRRVENTEHVAVALHDGHADVGLVEGELNRDGLDLEVLRRDELVVIAPFGHRFADEDDIEFSHLTAEPFVSRERGSGTRQVAEAAMAACRTAPRTTSAPFAEFSGIEPIKAAVEAGLGVAIVSALSIRRELQQHTPDRAANSGRSDGPDLAAVFAARQPVVPVVRELLRRLKAHGPRPRATRLGPA